jgi:hypothetical protein
MQSLVETVPKSTAFLTQPSESISLHHFPRKISRDRTKDEFLATETKRKAHTNSSSCFVTVPASRTHKVGVFRHSPSTCAHGDFQGRALQGATWRASSLCNIPRNRLQEASDRGSFISNNRRLTVSRESSSGIRRSRPIVLRQRARTQDDQPMQSKLWPFYLSHLLSAWGDKMWEFSVPFILLGLNRPDTMSFVGVYAICTGVANILFGPIIGYLVDKYPRLQTVIVTLVLQNVLISISFLLLYAVLSLSSSSGAVGCALISGVVTFCAAASLASTARFIHSTFLPPSLVSIRCPLTMSNTAHSPSKETGFGVSAIASNSFRDPRKSSLGSAPFAESGHHFWLGWS